MFVRFGQFQCQLGQSPVFTIFDAPCPQVSSSHSTLHRNLDFASSLVAQLPHPFGEPSLRNRGTECLLEWLRLMCRRYGQLVNSARRRYEMRHGEQEDDKNGGSPQQLAQLR